MQDAVATWCLTPGGVSIVASAADDVQLEANAGPVVIGSNAVAGNVQLWDNGAIDVSDNDIAGDLQCEGNDPTPTGGGNRVDGDAEGQCSALAL